MIGETIGNFRIVSRLGRGGMGEVYLAEQTNIGTKVAVKLLLPQISVDAEQVNRFFNEARAVQRIQHAGIVKIFDVGFHASGQAYLVMEYLEGESLARRIQRLRRLHPAEIADLGRQIASVLEATHGAGITHRDLKPENIYIVPDRELASRQRAKILDFGIAKLTGTLAHVSPQTIGTMGTPAYMAPEQWGDASRVDWRADLYSLGCVVFEMTCGRPPFVCTTIAEACGKHLTEQPPRASTIVPGIPPELDELLDQLLEKRPEDRPATMDEVVRRFEALGAKLGPAPAAAPSAPYTAPPAALPTGTPDPPPGAAARTMGATVGTGFGAPPGPTPVATPPPKRRRRGLALVLGGLAIAGVGAGLAVVAMSDEGGRASAPASAACPISPLPVLDGTSREPVLLRYTFKTGDETEATMIAQASTALTTDRGRETDDLTITFVGLVTWTALGGEDYAGELRATSFNVAHKAESDPVSGKPSHVSVHWSTDDTGSPPGEYAVLSALIGSPFTFTINSRGELASSNISGIQDLLTANNASTAIKAAFARDEVFRTMFFRLPDKPVKIGETWRGGEYLHALPNHNTLSAKLELVLAGVSSDRNHVLITAAPELGVDLSGTVSVVAKQTAFRIWGELDLSRGELVASALASCATLTLDQNGTHTGVVSEHIASYDTRPVERGVTPAPPADAAVAPEADAMPIDAAVRTPPRSRPDAAVAAVPQPAEPKDDARAGLAAAIRAARPELQKCAPPEGITVTVSMKINVDGRLSNIATAGASESANACVASALRPITIPRGASAQALTIAFPVVLAPAPGGDGNRADDLPDVPGKLQAVLSSANAAVLACGDGFAGSTQTTVVITIAPDGSVASAPNKAEPQQVRECVERTIKALRFMPSKRGKTVTYGYKVAR